MKKRTAGKKVFDCFNTLFMICVSIASIYPILYVLFASFSDSTQLMMQKGLLLKPAGFSLEAYRLVFKNNMIIRGYLNTIFILVAGVTLSIILSSIGAYCLSRKNLMWGKFMSGLVMFTMLFNGGVIPTFLLVKGLHLTNTLWSLIIPFAISTYNMTVMKTSFASIPNSLIESAKIDGAKETTILAKIVMPLSLPILAVMVLFYGVGMWNSWFYASIFLQKTELHPLQLVLRAILLQNDTASMTTGMADTMFINETLKYATIIVATVPILALYPFLQKYFVTGMMVGAVKE